MRTLNIFMAGLAASLAIFAACSKQEKPAEIPDVPQAPAENTDNGFQTLKATASDTKTIADGVHVLWTSGDVIGVFCGQVSSTTSATFTTSTSTPSASAEFTKSDENTPTKLDDYYYAAYPQAGINQWYYSENGGGVYRLYFSFNKEQTAVKGGWDPAHGAMAAKSTDNSFSFKHYSAYIKFTVGPSSSAFKSITVTSIDGTNIVDRLRIDIPAMTYSPNNLAALRSPYVKLSTSDGNAFEQGTYYICIIPRQYAQGFTLTFENAAGQTATKTVSGDFTFEAGDVANIGTVGTLSFVSPVTPLEVGTVYEESGKKQGVVYWVDSTNPYKGMVVSVSSAGIKWADDSYSELGGTDTNDGLKNYNTVTNYAAYISDPTHFPAMKYCADLRTSLGGNWYLPVVAELKDLFNAYYGLNITTWTNNTDYRFDSGSNLIDMNPKKKFDDALKIMGETTSASLDGDADYDGISDNSGYGTANGVQYWTSKVNSGGNTQYVRFGNYTNSNGTKTTEKYVRCIRAVEVQ